MDNIIKQKMCITAKNYVEERMKFLQSMITDYESAIEGIKSEMAMLECVRRVTGGNNEITSMESGKIDQLDEIP